MLRLASCVAPAVIAFALSVAFGAALVQDGAPFIQDEPRAMTRVVYFNSTGLAGEYAIEYGKPSWNAEWDKGFEKLTRGKRLRLGKDWWTALNSFCPLTFGEKVELKPGEYFLALDCSEKGDWSLVALDPEPLRKQRVDAFSSEQTKGGTRIPMKYEPVQASEAQLTIRFLKDEKDDRQQTLEIRFGRHRLTALVKPKV